jgi:uncharacterized protein YndB with AHSA1/START domain
MKTTDPPIVVTQVFNTTPNVVWNAITQLAPMQQWFFNNIPNFKSVVGFETQFDICVEDRVFTHLWKITEVVPLSKIVYQWHYANHQGRSTVAFEITPKNNETTLQVTAVAIESFDDTIPEFKRESALAGWTYLIQQSLVAYLQKNNSIEPEN